MCSQNLAPGPALTRPAAVSLAGCLLSHHPRVRQRPCSQAGSGAPRAALLPAAASGGARQPALGGAGSAGRWAERQPLGKPHRTSILLARWSCACVVAAEGAGSLCPPVFLPHTRSRPWLIQLRRPNSWSSPNLANQSPSCLVQDVTVLFSTFARLSLFAIMYCPCRRDGPIEEHPPCGSAEARPAAGRGAAGGGAGGGQPCRCPDRCSAHHAHRALAVAPAQVSDLALPGVSRLEAPVAKWWAASSRARRNASFLWAVTLRAKLALNFVFGGVSWEESGAKVVFSQSTFAQIPLDSGLPNPNRPRSRPTLTTNLNLRRALHVLESACFACPENEAFLLGASVTVGVPPMVASPGGPAAPAPPASRCHASPPAPAATSCPLAQQSGGCPAKAPSPLLDMCAAALLIARTA